MIKMKELINIKLHAEIKGTEREGKWEYPIEAIIESLTQI